VSHFFAVNFESLFSAQPTALRLLHHQMIGGVMVDVRRKIGTKLDRVCYCGHPLDSHSKTTPHRCIKGSGCTCIAFDSPAGGFEQVRFDDPDDE
jgi:hypothetical protein